MRVASKIALFLPVFAIAAECGVACGTFSGASSTSNPSSDSSVDATNFADASGNVSDVSVAEAADDAGPLPECTAQRLVTLVGGNGGLAWFTQVWPVPDVIVSYESDYAFDNPANAMLVLGMAAAHPLYARLIDAGPVLRRDRCRIQCRPCSSRETIRRTPRHADANLLYSPPAA